MDSNLNDSGADDWNRLPIASRTSVLNQAQLVADLATRCVGEPSQAVKTVSEPLDRLCTSPHSLMIIQNFYNRNPHRTRPFQQDQLWRYAADFKTLTGKQLSVKMKGPKARASWRCISIRASLWRRRSSSAGMSTSLCCKRGRMPCGYGTTYVRTAAQRYRIIYRVERSTVTVAVVAAGIRKEGGTEDIYTRWLRDC